MDSPEKRARVAAVMANARHLARERGTDIEFAETFFFHDKLVFTNIELV